MPITISEMTLVPKERRPESSPDWDHNTSSISAFLPGV